MVDTLKYAPEEKVINATNQQILATVEKCSTEVCYWGIYSQSTIIAL